MKKQINPTIKAHLLRCASFVPVLVAICAIPFALAQQSGNRNAANHAATQSADGAVHGTEAVPDLSNQNQVPRGPTQACTPGTPGTWMMAAPVTVDHYGGFMDSNGTFGYEGGGYSFSAAGNITQFGRFDPVANTWTPLTAVPDLNNGEASGVYAPNVNKLFVFGGENVGTATVVNTTRIYDITTGTWSMGAAMPDVRAFMASGYFNGKIYLVAGYNTGNVDPSFGQVWEYDPVANTFNTTRLSMPATLGGPGFGIINGHLYVAGGRDLNNTNLTTLYDYDIAMNTWTTRASLPVGVNVPASAVIGGKLWVFGGGNPFTGPEAFPRSGVRIPDTTNILQIYDPVANAWTSSPPNPVLNQQRAFPAGTDIGNIAVAVGGYTGSNTTTSVETNLACGPTPTPTPSCTPSPVWATASPYPSTIVRYGFAQTATHLYVFGGVSNGTRVNNVNRMDLATGMWQSRAPMPFTSEAPTCALMEATGLVYCAEGDTGSGFASYNIATDTWTPLAAIPGGDHYGSASGAFNGRVFVAGGTTSTTNAVQVYTVATNTWSAGTVAPDVFLLAGYRQVGQYLYVVGGFNASSPDSVAASSVLYTGRRPNTPSANSTGTWRLDMTSAPGVWSVGPAFPQSRADFGLSFDTGTGKLYALGGDASGGSFFDSTNLVDELSVASWPAGTWTASPPNLLPPNRQANQAGFYGAGDIWSVGGLVGQTFQFLAEVQRRTNACPSCTPSWRNEPAMTNARRNAATAVVGSNLYAITGFNFAPDYTTANERFDGATWTAMAPIPVPHAQGRGAAVGTNIYVPGGFNSVSFGGPLNTMQIYSTTANTWSAGMTLPAARSGVATAAVNNLVYVIGGYNPVGTGHNDVYIYNPATNTYANGAPMPGNQGNMPGVLYNGEIYVVGGGTAPGAQFAYNPGTNMWRTIAAIPTTGGMCQSANGFVQDGELWIVGCLGLAINQQVWIYNSGTDMWRAGPPYSVDHQGPGAALFNFRGFVVGGGTPSGGTTAVESVGSCIPTAVANTVSRRTHSGGAGTFDIYLPLTGTPGIEDRCGVCFPEGANNDYTIVVTFSGNVVVSGSPQAQVTSGTGCVGTGGVCTGNVTVSGGTVTIPLTNVPDDQTINVRLNGVNGASDAPEVDVNIPMTIVVGDSNSNGVANSSDIGQTKGRIGLVVDGTNFRSDANASGGINSSDVSIIKNNLP